MASKGQEEEDVRLIKCYSYPVSFPTRGPASLLPSPCPALHRPFCSDLLFSRPLLFGGIGSSGKGGEGLRGPALDESRGGASTFNLEPILGCRYP